MSYEHLRGGVLDGEPRRGLGFYSYELLGASVCAKVGEPPEALSKAVGRSLAREGAAVGAMVVDREERPGGCKNTSLPHTHFFFAAPLLATDAPGRLVEEARA